MKSLDGEYVKKKKKKKKKNFVFLENSYLFSSSPVDGTKVSKA
jgi:hypothetical protein